MEKIVFDEWKRVIQEAMRLTKSSEFEHRSFVSEAWPQVVFGRRPTPRCPHQDQVL